MIVVISREVVEINYFSFILLILLKPFDDGLVQPLPHRLSGVLGLGCKSRRHVGDMSARQPSQQAPDEPTQIRS